MTVKGVSNSSHQKLVASVCFQPCLGQGHMSYMQDPSIIYNKLVLVCCKSPAIYESSGTREHCFVSLLAVLSATHIRSTHEKCSTHMHNTHILGVQALFILAVEN